MPHSSPATRKRPSHSSRPSRGRNRPPQRSRIPATRLALLASALAIGSIATGAYFAFHDDVFAGLVGRQAERQVHYEAQIADLRAQIDRIKRLDQVRVEEQVKTMLQRQATLDQVTPGLANELSVQARNGLPASLTIDSMSSPIETTSPIPHVGSAKPEATTNHKKVRLHPRKQAPVVHRQTQEAPVVRRQTQEAPTVAANPNASRPEMQNY